jgi:adenylyltransferase/sulfurtransferase
MVNRYDRQQRIEGWKQDALTQGRAVIVGAGPLGQMAAAGLASLGIGTVELTGIDGGGLPFLQGREQRPAERLETAIAPINPEVAVLGVHGDPSLPGMREMVGTPGILIETTGRKDSIEACARLAEQKGFPFIVGNATRDRIWMDCWRPGEPGRPVQVPEQAAEQPVAASTALAGMICEEARKLLMRRPEDQPVPHFESPIVLPRTLEEGLVIICGAGALSNSCTLALACELQARAPGKYRLVIVDPDVIEDTNLNRQFIYRTEDLGRNKAEVLCTRITGLTGIEARPVVGRVDEEFDWKEHGKPALMVECTDSFAARAGINRLCRRKRIPLVSGGTSPFQGQVVVYVRGKSCCLDCALDVEAAAERAAERARNTCIAQPNPSVVTTNMAIGGFMAIEALNVLAGEGYSIQAPTYDAHEMGRFGLTGASVPCTCK